MSKTLTPTQPISGEIVARLEAENAALRTERDTLQAQLAAATVKQTIEALTLPYPPTSKDYHEAVIQNINCRINVPQRLALRALFTGLYKSHATTADGKPVHLPVHAVQWLLENITFSKAG